MSTRGQFNTKNPTIKRILKEAAELASNASPDYHAEPLEDNLFEWHFTLRGPPAPSPYANGLYHGRIVLPAAYPLRPPSFRFVTPSGRFEANREICLSISGHHEESWQPAWGIRTALVAIRSFMDTDAKGQLGGVDAPRETRRALAAESVKWRCGVCGRCNGEIMREREELAREAEGQGEGKEETVPEELRLAYREELGKEGDDAKAAEVPKEGEQKPEASSSQATVQAQVPVPAPAPPAAPQPAQRQTDAPAATTPVTAPTPTPTPTRTIPAPTLQQPRTNEDGIPAWIDKAIFCILIALVSLVIRRFL